MKTHAVGLTLGAYANDVYITGAPQTTFFRTVYRGRLQSRPRVLLKDRFRVTYTPLASCTFRSSEKIKEIRKMTR